MGTKDFGPQWAEREGEATMKKCVWVAAVLCLASAYAHAQEAKQPWDEYDKLIKSSEAVTSLGPSLLGDNVNLSNGALSFANTDVSVPGNNALPVEVRRSLSVGNRKGYQANDLPFADWDLDVPRIHGVFQHAGAGAGFGTACVATDPLQARPPSIWTGTEWLQPEDYWQGNQASLPGGGEMLLVRPGVTAPTTGGPYYWLTSGFTHFACLAEIKNGSGQGFRALTTDGTRYWFDWAASYREPDIKGGGKGASTIARRKAVLYATRVEDRFGNWVTYDYANASNAPGRLTRIASSDGRVIGLDYNAQGHVSLVTSGDRHWSYVYDYSDPSAASLTAVTLPDQSQWKMAFAAFNAGIRSEKPRCAPTGSTSMCDVVRTCDSPGLIISPDPSPGRITHPSGATGEFTVRPVRHGRSNVPRVCTGYNEPNNDPNDDSAYYPLNYDAFSLISKKVTGPGLAPAEWSYGYGAEISWAPDTGPVCTTGDCGAPVCTSDSCAKTAVTTVNGPSGDWSRYTFGNSYRYNEGKLLKVELGNGPGSIAKTETTAYELRTSGLPFPTPIGTSPQPRGDGFTSEYLSPQRQHAIVQDGANFNSLVNQFDSMARPINVGSWSSLGNPGRTEVTEYHDHPSKWVMGLPKRQINAETGLVMSQTDYWPATALPQRTWAFGKAQQYFEYNADGTLAKFVDGNNNATMPSEWKRGIPQRITHADGTYETADVNDHGWVRSITDENRFTTTYGHDPMGRLASVVYPAGDTTGWANKTLAFELINFEEYGLAPGHWRQAIRTGNYRKFVFYDALWRPVAEQEDDFSRQEQTLKWTARRYDAKGNVVFESYARNPFISGWVRFDAALSGIHTSYDALDRVTRVEQDSEHGRLATITEYLTGFQRRTTNPRGLVTTETFQAYDQPTYDLPWIINAPESVKTVIERDRFGKPLEVTRSGPDG
ncbi:RHS repeat domain-containing protein [Lysobacter koreensis]|uniref:RHS repeat domain-containing protein n=1 Tax=Lysobacter koreensis TaxID=266122 RepID=A0ABW2YQN5_9GAMM